MILTGTPAGSSVVVPGDVVEVEVDAPARGLTTGRLGHDGDAGRGMPFDAALGSLPAVDDTQRAEAWGSRRGRGPADAASSAERRTIAPTIVLRRRSPVLTRRSCREQARSASRSPGSRAQLRKRGLNNVTIDGVRPMHPGTKLVGTAKTLRFVPDREDLFASHGGGYNAQKRAFDAVGEGEVIVIEARGETGSGTLGDILALRAHARGAAGIVTDGGVRDYDAVAAHRHPGLLRRRAPRRPRPQARAVGRRRDDRMRRHDRAAGRHHRGRRATA